MMCRKIYLDKKKIKENVFILNSEIFYHAHHDTIHYSRYNFTMNYNPEISPLSWFTESSYAQLIMPFSKCCKCPAFSWRHVQILRTIFFEMNFISPDIQRRVSKNVVRRVWTCLQENIGRLMQYIYQLCVTTFRKLNQTWVSLCYNT